MTLAPPLAALAGAFSVFGAVDFALAYAQNRRAATASGQTRKRPLATAAVRFLTRVGRLLHLPAPTDLQTRLTGAGVVLSLADAMAIKVGAAVVSALALLPIASSFNGRTMLLFFAVVPVSAFIAPDLWLRQQARARGLKINAEFPDVVDLLTVSLSAGMGTTRALAEVGAHHHGVLATEFCRVVSQIGLGEPFDRAIDNLEARCATTGVATLVATLRRAERHGMSIVSTLSAQVQRARADQARAAAEQAARAAPKIQLIAALLLVPSVLLLIAAAILPSIVTI